MSRSMDSRLFYLARIFVHDYSFGLWFLKLLPSSVPTSHGPARIPSRTLMSIRTLPVEPRHHANFQFSKHQLNPQKYFFRLSQVNCFGYLESQQPYSTLSYMLVFQSTTKMASLQRSLQHSSPLLRRMATRAPTVHHLGRTSTATIVSNPPASQYVDLDVGEIEGGIVKIKPIPRTGEDIHAKRSRLLCKPVCSYHDPGAFRVLVC